MQGKPEEGEGVRRRLTWEGKAFVVLMTVAFLFALGVVVARHAYGL